MNLGLLLRLGRVSNLPTVWTNALAGSVLAGGWSWGGVLLCGLILTLFYEGGMWLNDAYDAEIDKAQRADRPIPNGEIARGTVFAAGWAMLGAGLILSLWSGGPWTVPLTALALVAAIVLYDWLHKRTALAPLLMGTTRFLCYALAGAIAFGGWNGPLAVAAAGLFALVVGITYAARQESYDRIGRAWPLAVLAIPVIIAFWATYLRFWPLLIAVAFLAAVLWAVRRFFRRAPGDVPTGVVTLIAAISLYDAVLIAAVGSPALALLALGGFVLTLLLQRVVSGT
jgi:4-hydroxybenzoate polyprenyltransferase